MTSVLKFRAEAEDYPEGNLQAWVTGYIDRMRGLGQESITYIGCSKKISPLGFVPWFCRKRLGADKNLLEDEYLNHDHAHGGKCSHKDYGIPCFAMKVKVYDDSGSLDAEIWAPSMHVLAMDPSAWMELDKEQQSQEFLLARKRPFKMRLMAVSKRGLLSHFKIQFVEPVEYVSKDCLADPEFFDMAVKMILKPAGYVPQTVCVAELSTEFESISVVEDEDEQAICTAGVQFAPPSRTIPIAMKMEQAIELISKSHDGNVKAVSLLNEIMWELASSSGS